MPYHVDLSSNAKDELANMERDLRRRVIDRLLDLTEWADSMCRPSVMPYPPGYLTHRVVA